MNDDFLTQFLEMPSIEFADALYERISQEPQPHFAQMMRQKLTLRNSVIMLAFLFLVAACVYAVTEERWNKVGDIWVDVQRTRKVEFMPPPELSEELNVQPQDYGCFTINKARELLRFELRVPTWAPSGFILDDKICHVDQLSDFANLYWRSTEKKSFLSLMARNLRGFNISTQKYEIGPAMIWGPVAPGSYKEVQVHGQPAVLVHGDWDLPRVMFEEAPPDQELNVEAKWNKKLAVQLYWVDGEVLYYLYADANIPAKELIKMAESTR